MAVRIVVDTFKFLKLTKESVDFVFNFSAVFSDELAEDFEFRRVKNNSRDAVDVISFVSDDDSASLIRTLNYYILVFFLKIQTEVSSHSQ